MRRREFITLLGSAAVRPTAARGQLAERVRRIGVLMGYTENDPAAQAQIASFGQELNRVQLPTKYQLVINLRTAAALGIDVPLHLEQHADEVIDRLAPSHYAIGPAAQGRLLRDGSGSASHLAGELSKLMAGVDLVHVPYRGGAAMITDLIGGQVQVGFDVMPTSIPHIRTGALRALGVTNTKRYVGLPDVPSIAETVTGYEARTWAGVGVPKGTPTSIILRFNREVNDGLANPAIRARLADIGTIPMVFTPDEFGAFIGAETEKWGKVVRSAGIKPE